MNQHANISQEGWKEITARVTELMQDIEDLYPNKVVGVDVKFKFPGTGSLTFGREWKPK